ncbi:hypothetical protein [Raineyella fluvialis]|uniref:Uncharacterized protein n=1 Tax=Raineyella fluvialis TaxID=2662261 RepID=A0A5Q2FCB3_9ACTN|nr:hypothetical protein [Raineyella fluvialis]QGF24021.1 hypothetical protein Rai3103_10380 [Raineyella fluvialis]
MAEPGDVAGWHRALAYALCGEDLPGLVDRPAPDPAALAEELREAGWDRLALRDHVARTRAAGEPWPHPVPPQLTADLSAAQLAAALRALNAEWELAPPRRQVRSGPPPKASAGDERLLRDLPPHFGKL